MIRKTLIGLAVASAAALGASAANAGSYGGGYDDNYGGYNDNYVYNAGYYCHWHVKKKVIRILVGYDYYGYPIYKKRIKYIRFCHKHYNQYNSY